MTKDEKQETESSKVKAESSKVKAESSRQKKEGGDLLKAACEAYGIGEEFVLSHGKTDDGGIRVLTAGGAKVKYHPDTEDIETLAPERVDGVSRKKPKAVLGKKK